MPEPRAPGGHDDQRYTVVQLREWKAWAEEEARREVEGDGAPDAGGGPTGRRRCRLIDELPEPGPLPPGFRMPLPAQRAVHRAGGAAQGAGAGAAGGRTGARRW